MNNSLYIIRRARLIKDPTTRTVGQDKKEITTITVAMNSFGKAKDRYKSMFVDISYAGAMGVRAQGLRKGDEISASGCLEMREYQRNNGGVGIAFEIQYPNDLIVLSAQGAEEAAATTEAAPEAPAAVSAEDAFPGI